MSRRSRAWSRMQGGDRLTNRRCDLLLPILPLYFPPRAAFFIRPFSRIIRSHVRRTRPPRPPHPPFSHFFNFIFLFHSILSTIIQGYFGQISCHRLILVCGQIGTPPPSVQPLSLAGFDASEAAHGDPPSLSLSSSRERIRRPSLLGSMDQPTVLFEGDIFSGAGLIRY